jgi:methyl-accepting chemotaxis protein
MVQSEMPGKRLLLRASLVKTITLMLTFANISSLLLGISLIFLVGGLVPYAILLSTIVSGLFYVGSYLLARSGNSTRRLDTAIYVMLSGLLVELGAGQILLGGGSALPAGFILVSVLAGITGIPRRSLIISTAFSFSFSAILYSLEKMAKLFEPGLDINQYPIINLIVLLILSSVIAAGIVVFTQKIRTSQLVTEEQNAKLNELVGMLKSTAITSANLSRDLTGATTELRAVIQQHNAGSMEQVAAITQVTVGIEELNENARQIVQSAEAATNSAEQTFNIANLVNQDNVTALERATVGNQVVQDTVMSVQKVQHSIETLAQHLLKVTRQAANVNSILGLITNISDETHLLALNASIEAAGVGESGKRFSVIANEVKSLADRSIEAANEVRQIIGELQGAVTSAVLRAEEGKKETYQATAKAQISGEVIQELTQVMNESTKRAHQILEASETVQTRCQEIRLATSQQRSANGQTLSSMRDVSVVSQQNAQSIQMLLEIASRVDESSVVLSRILAEANAPLAEATTN